MQFKAVVALLAAFVGCAAGVLIGKPAEANHSSKPAIVIPTTSKVTAADVAKLHHKMEGIAVALEGLLKPDGAKSLAHAKVAPAFRMFVDELRTTLVATAVPKDLQAAMKRLKNAQAGMADLTKALNAQQESLMHDDAVEEANLLMGVLMVRCNASMAKQLEVLKSSDFSGLPVAQMLLKKHDQKVPLVQQVAEFMDAHGKSSGVAVVDEKAQRLAKTTTFFEQRVSKMEHEEEVMEKSYRRTANKIDELIKKSSKAVAHTLQMKKKHLDRDFKKRVAVHKQQTMVMKDVVSALHRGDTAALKKAQAALQAHLEAMKAQTGNFLYLLQLGHRLAQSDCPFCVAQCIGKCHDNGGLYAQCMTQCADAGH